MATMTTGTGTLSPELRTYYQRRLLRTLMPILVYSRWGNLEPMPRNEGQSVNFRRFENLPLATTPLTEGVTPASVSGTVTQITATPEQYGSWIEISDKLDFTAPDPVLTQFTAKLGLSAAETIDTVIRDILHGGTNVQYAAGRVSRDLVASTDKLNETEIRKAVRTMQNNKVSKLSQMLNASTGVGTSPIPTSYIAIVGASTLFDLKADPKWVPVHKYAAPGEAMPYEEGAIDDVRFIRSTNSKVYASAGASNIDVHATLVLGADAYGLVVPSGLEFIAKGFGQTGLDPLDQRATAGWKAFFTGILLEQLALLRIEHAVS